MDFLKKSFFFIFLFFSIQCEYTGNDSDIILNENDSQIERRIIEYYKNGNVKFEGQTINGKFEGFQRWYYSSGNIEIETNYSNDIEHGIQIIYYDKPKSIKNINHFKKGALEDTSKYYYLSGVLQAFHIYDSFGLIKEVHTYSVSGKLLDKKYFKPDKDLKESLLDTIIRFY